MMQIQEVEQSLVGENCLSGGLGFIGIRHRKWGKWGAEIRLCRSRRKIWLGSYNTPQQAALAYDAALFCLRGPNSQFNFPDSCDSISSSISSSSSRSSSRTCMSANEIKNFSRQYALQHGNAADAGDPASSLQQQQQEEERINDDYRYEDVSVSAAASVAALAFSEVDRPCPWDLQNNVSWLQLELERDAMQFCNFTMEQHFNHEIDTPDDDAYESEGSNCFQSIWSM